jgi:hypothetical protein
MLVSSNVVIQFPDGGRKAVTPEQAKAHIEDMNGQTRTLYEKP